VSVEAVETDSCDLCIVGAGLAGMNALAVASQYLRRGARVILVDRRPRVGGMWVDAYPYVRLHQPHPWFTAGDIGWTQGHDRSHLATRPEVLDHFQHCLDVVRRRVTVDTLLGWEFDGYEESGGTVTVRCHTADAAP
jgi:cation diffusion facilitator CzcD-associated flavoprotein CzcO